MRDYVPPCVRVPLTAAMDLSHHSLRYALRDWCWSVPEVRRVWRLEAKVAKLRARDPSDPARRAAEGRAIANAEGMPCR
jgi:hypothetical protein